MGEWFPGQMSESALLWDSVDMVVKQIKNGRLRLSSPSIRREKVIPIGQYYPSWPAR